MTDDRFRGGLRMLCCAAIFDTHQIQRCVLHEWMTAARVNLGCCSLVLAVLRTTAKRRRDMEGEMSGPASSKLTNNKPA